MYVPIVQSIDSKLMTALCIFCRHLHLNIPEFGKALINLFKGNGYNVEILIKTNMLIIGSWLGLVI